MCIAGLHYNFLDKPIGQASETVLVPVASVQVGNNKPSRLDSAEPAKPFAPQSTSSHGRGPGPSPLGGYRPHGRHPHRHGRNQQGFAKPQVPPEKPDMFFETVGPIPASPDYKNEIEEDDRTCGIARITDGPGNSGMALRILGGREAKKGKWPWQVALMNRMQVIKKCS